MASRVHRLLKIIAFNANGIGRQRHELSKQLQDLRIEVACFLRHIRNSSEVLHYKLPRLSKGPIPGRKGGTAVTVRKGIPHNNNNNNNNNKLCRQQAEVIQNHEKAKSII
jgi:hypothetical protein